MLDYQDGGQGVTNIHTSMHQQLVEFTFGSTCQLSTVSSLSTMSNSVVCVSSTDIGTLLHSGCHGLDQMLNDMHRLVQQLAQVEQEPCWY